MQSGEFFKHYRRSSTGGGGSEWIKADYEVAPSATLTIDTLTDSQFEHITYIIHARNTDRSKVRSYMLAVHRRDSTVDDSVVNKFGKGLNIAVDTDLTAGTYTLDFTNNEGESVFVRIARIILV